MGPGKGKHIVLMAGDEEYRSEEALPMLAKILSQKHGFKCTVLFSVNDDGTINPNKSESLSNPAALDSADAIIMSLRFRKYPEDVLQALLPMRSNAACRSSACARVRMPLAACKESTKT